MFHFQKLSSKPAASFLLALTLGFGLSQVLAPQPQTIAIAQESAVPAFPLPTSVPSGTSVKLDGSTSMSVINETFKKRFEEKFSGSQINLATSSSAEALQALKDGKIDVAALGRPLTEAEKAEGFKPVVLSREKIAILLGPDNPFQGDISFAQFAKIFRGEITDWSELGGAPGPIRFIDRPDNSDTRLSLSRYKVFEEVPFQTGSNAKQVAQDDTATILKELGKDGISYAIASHAINNDKARIVPMHKTLPDDPRYPYSQPRNYVYKAAADGSVSPAVQAFLGYAGSPDGAKVVQEAQLAEAAAAGAVVAGAAALNAPKPTETASPATSPDANPATTADSSASPMVSDRPEVIAQAPGSYTPETKDGLPGWLLPLAAIVGAGGLLWLLKGRKGAADVSPTETRKLAGVGGRTPLREPEFTGNNRPPTQPSAGGTAGTSSSAGGAPPATTSSSPRSTTGPGIGGVAAGLGAAAAGAGLAGAAAAMAGKAWNSRLQLTPRSATEAEASWGWEVGHRDALKQQGGHKSMLRLYDVTNIDPDRQTPNSVRQYDCAETATSMRVPITVADRDYVAELGYATEDGRWIKGMRSNQVRIPGAPVTPAPTTPAPTTPAPTTPAPTTATTPAPTTATTPAPTTPAPTTPAPTTPAPTTPAPATNLSGAAALGGAAVAAGAGLLAARGLLPTGNHIGIKSFGERSVYANWDLTPESQNTAKQQGGKTMQLRVYDTTDIDLDKQPPNNVQTFNCNETSHDKLINVPHPGRDYVAEVGYSSNDNRWLPLARSQPLSGLDSINKGLGLAAAGVVGTAGVKWGQAMPKGDMSPKHPETARYTIDGKTNSFILNPEQAARLSDQSAATQTLEPGHYTLRIKEGKFSYRPLWDHPGEPWVLIWLKGQLTGLRTNTRVASTWLTLNGYQDEYKFQVHEPTKLHAFFVDTNVVDNDGEVTLSITRDS